jgi:PAS domain S-box-containing protein
MGTSSLSTPLRLGRQRLFLWATALTTSVLTPLILWPSLWRDAFSSAYLPHAFCYLSDGKLIWLHFVADVLIGAAYVAISFTLAYLVYRARRDIPFQWMFLAFGLFIISCGMTHFMEVVVLWKPLYWFSGDVKIVTALASVATAVALPRLVPQTLALIKDRRVKLEQANSRLEELNRRLVERDQIKTALVRATVAGVAGWEMSYPGGEITWLEDPCPLFGRTAAELRTVQQWEPIVHPEDRPRLRELLNDLGVPGREYDVEYRVVWPDGSVRWVAVRARSCREADGKPLRVVGLAIDITNRKHGEEALRTSEKLAAAGQLAATIAHEINNPLEAVTNLLYLMRTSNNPDYLNMAEHELARINHIARLTLGFYGTDRSPVRLNLTEVIEGALDVFRGKVRSRGVEIETSYRSKGEIDGYLNELRQAFGNLIGNALDAMSWGGKLRVRMTAYCQGLRITIADNGSGIASENLGKAFQPFFTANKEVGAGLGLWLTKEVVQKHGGSIRVRSSTDAKRHGTVFMIWLPVTEPLLRESAA